MPVFIYFQTFNLKGKVTLVYISAPYKNKLCVDIEEFIECTFIMYTFFV